MANNATGTIQVPVALQVSLGNLTQVIAQLKSSLKNVSKDSSVYSGLVTQIAKLEQKAAELKTSLSTPFQNQSEINAYGRAFTTLANNVQTTATRMSNLKFSQLLFSEEELAQVRAGEEQVRQALQNLTNLKNTFLQSMRSGDLGSFFNMAGVTDATSYEDAIKKVTEALEKAQQAAAKAKEQLGLLNEKLAEQEAAKKIAQEKSDLAEVAATDTTTFFTAPDDSGKQDYRFGGKANLKSMMKESGFSQDEIDKIENMTATEVVKWFNDIKQALSNGAKKATQQYNATSQQVTEQQRVVATADENVNKGQQAVTGLKGLTETEAYKALETQIASLRQELNRLKEEAAKSSQTVTQSGRAAEAAKSSLNQMTEGLKQASAAMENLQRQQRALDGIKTTISNFMGFYQVLNLVKSGITSMISTVRELDAVMTQIAIVTDMSQSDLWAQMDTYSSLANQYGTSIKGVYEVSQLYYQQGLKQKEVMDLTEQTLVLAKLSNLDYTTATDYMTVA